jgi:hypothetical protein
VLKRSELVILIFILSIASVLSLSLLTRGHLWWDDFASYIMQAQSLLEGSTNEFMQRNAFTIGASSYLIGPVAYPWGYPLLLAPVLALFGLKILALKALNTIFHILFLIAFHLLARLRLPPSWSLFLTAFFAFNPALLLAHDLILSDIPFLFFSTLTLFLIEKSLPAGEARSDGAAKAQTWDAGLIGAVISAAFALRTNGLLLLGVLAIAQLVHFRDVKTIRRNIAFILLPYLAFGFLTLLQILFLPGGQESHLAEFARLTPGIVMDNAVYYLALPAGMFDGIPLGVIFFSVAVLFFFVGVAANPRRNSALITYILLTLGLYISWPERQGLRFLYPILPLIVLMAFDGWQVFLKKLPAGRIAPANWTGAALAGTLIILSLVSTAQAGWVNLQNERTINGPFDPVSSEMFEFVREQTPPKSVVIFFRPRVLRLLTDRDAFLSTSCDDFSRANYVVFHEKQGSNGQVPEPEACTNVHLTAVFNNLRFTVYQVTQ